MDILKRAIKLGGPTQEAFAAKIGKRQSYVSMLLYRVKAGRLVPADICPKIEEATGGAITRHDLRPDIFGPGPADTVARPKRRRPADERARDAA